MLCGKNHGHRDETAFGENYVRFVFFDELASLRIAFQHADRIREVFQIKITAQLAGGNSVIGNARIFDELALDTIVRTNIVDFVIRFF